MASKGSCINVVFAGGGTGGHIYPGLAVAEEFKSVCKKNNVDVRIHWIGNSKGMDKDIVQKTLDNEKNSIADFFYGIPSGKLRRYFSFQNFFDLFKIFAGFICSLFIICKVKPVLLFSKGGFVSVPPCIAAKLLKIPVYTHECDFTPGLATKINSRFAKNILVSFEKTKNYLPIGLQNKVIFTGDPIRTSFYSADAKKGLDFLNIKEKTKPILLVCGGSLGARQINELVQSELEWLCSNFIVIHQTGQKNVEQTNVSYESNVIKENYKPYAFIYNEMPDVLAASDIVLSRSGANSVWESSVLGKPMVLVPLCGSGTRGDQEDNAEFFKKHGAAFVLSREGATSEKLKECLSLLLDDKTRMEYSKNSLSLSDGIKPSLHIANILWESIRGIYEF